MYHNHKRNHNRNITFLNKHTAIKSTTASNRLKYNHSNSNPRHIHNYSLIIIFSTIVVTTATAITLIDPGQRQNCNSDTDLWTRFTSKSQTSSERKSVFDTTDLTTTITTPQAQRRPPTTNPILIKPSLTTGVGA